MILKHNALLVVLLLVKDIVNAHGKNWFNLELLKICFAKERLTVMLRLTWIGQAPLILVLFLLLFCVVSKVFQLSFCFQACLLSFQT